MDTLNDTTSPATSPINGAAAGSTETAAAAWIQLPVRAYLNGPDVPVAVTLADTGADAVILRAAGPTSVELVRDRRITREADTALAIPISDPARQAELLRAALAADIGARQEADTAAEQRRVDLAVLRESQGQTLEEIRDYVIEEYRDGELTRTVLNAFLERFDLEPYRPRVKVTYRITGSFEVDSDDRDEVESDVDDNLRVDIDDIDNVVDDSGDVNLSIISVEPIDD